VRNITDDTEIRGTALGHCPDLFTFVTRSLHNNACKVRAGGLPQSCFLEASSDVPGLIAAALTRTNASLGGDLESGLLRFAIPTAVRTQQDAGLSLCVYLRLQLLALFASGNFKRALEHCVNCIRDAVQS
jgi:hypothetical protein